MRNRVKQIRKELHLTQAQFGDRLGIKQNTIAGWESGKGNMSYSTIKHICAEFGVNEKWLQYGVGDIFQPQRHNYKETIELLRAFVHLPYKDQSSIIEIILNRSEERKAKAK